MPVRRPRDRPGAPARSGKIRRRAARKRPREGRWPESRSRFDLLEKRPQQLHAGPRALFRVKLEPQRVLEADHRREAIALVNAPSRYARRVGWLADVAVGVVRR